MTRLTPQSAMMLALQAAVLALLLDRPLNLALLAGCAALYWLAGGGLRHWRLTVVVLALGTWVMVTTQAMFYGAMPRTVLLTLLGPDVFPFGMPPGLYLYKEGFVHGLVQSLRFDAVLLMGAGLLTRYATDEMMSGLRGLRMPAPLAFLFALALRFVPMMAAEARAVWTAQRLRGMVFFSGSPWRWPSSLARAARALLVPLIAATVRRSDEVAASLIGRGISPQDASPPPAIGRVEMAVWAFGAVALFILFAAQILTRLYQAGVYAHARFDWVYYLVRHFV